MKELYSSRWRCNDIQIQCVKQNTSNTMKTNTKRFISLITAPHTAFLMYEIGEEIKSLMDNEHYTFDDAVSTVKHSKEAELQKRQNKVGSLEGFFALKMNLSIKQLQDEIKIIEVLFKGWLKILPRTVVEFL